MNIMAVLLLLNMRYLEQRIGNEHVSGILWCAGIVLATLLLKRPLSLLLAKLISGVANRFSEASHRKLFQHLTVRPLELLLQTFLYYIAINQLTIFLNHVLFSRGQGDGLWQIRVSDVADKVFFFLLIGFFILVVSRIVDFVFSVSLEKARREANLDKEQLLPLLKEVIKLLVWVIGIFWILGSVFNVNIPALVAGLGIGGIAIALAAKESVENLFAAFTILADKPFRTDDVVKLGVLQGKVERIGFRSTRLRNADGSVYIIPNKKLVGENLENLTQRDTSKVQLVFNIKYGISQPRLQQMMESIREMIQEAAHIQQPVSVLLEGFGENSFQLSVSYTLGEPLGEGVNAEQIRQLISMEAFRIVSDYTNGESTHITPGSNPEPGKEADTPDKTL